jgi:DNA-binding NarL/FixJ family response regulator
MFSTTRTLLIVEDDQTLNAIYKHYCEEALKELPFAGVVKQAFSYEQAKDILDTQAIDLISVDIALSKEEEDKTDQERSLSEAGGIALLRELQAREKHPLFIVVSGETLQSYVIDAYRTYGVLAFYQKARLNDEEYKHAIKAALFFLAATETMAQPETEMDLEAAQASWQQALAAAQVADIRAHDFPEDLGKSIALMYSKQTDAVTGLPNSHWTEAKFRGKIIGQQEWALIRVTIKGFNKFVTTYASQEEPILFFVGRLLKSVRDEFDDQRLFIGHLGHYEYSSEPSFVILLNPKSTPHLHKMAHWLEDKFSRTGSGPFMPQFGQVDQPELTFSLEAKTMTGAEYNFHDLHELLDRLRLL